MKASCIAASTVGIASHDITAAEQGAGRSMQRIPTMIATRVVLALVPEPERTRLIWEYVDQSGDATADPLGEHDAFLDFLEGRLPDPSHALSLCRMRRALTKARLGTANFVAGETIRARAQSVVAHEVWACIESSGEARAEPEVWDCIVRRVRQRIDTMVWQAVADAVDAPITRGAAASLVWFHADPNAVLRAVRGGVPPPVGARAWPLLFAPGLVRLWRIATAEEAALWERLPTADTAPELVARLLEEGVVTRVE